MARFKKGDCVRLLSDKTWVNTKQERYSEAKKYAAGSVGWVVGKWKPHQPHMVVRFLSGDDVPLDMKYWGSDFEIVGGDDD